MGPLWRVLTVEKFSCDRLREISQADIKARFQQFESLASFEGMRF